MVDTIREIGGRPILWRDKGGVTHACKGCDGPPGVRLFWPVCGRGDVPAGEGFQPGPADEVTCPACILAGARP